MKGFEGLTVLRRVAFAAMALAACPAAAGVNDSLEPCWPRIRDSR